MSQKSGAVASQGSGLKFQSRYNIPTKSQDENKKENFNSMLRNFT